MRSIDVGEDVESSVLRLLQAANYDVERAECVDDILNRQDNPNQLISLHLQDGNHTHR